MVVPYPPGGANDILARAINVPLGAELGQPVVVMNRPGAGGNIGTAQVIAARNDGHTIVLHGMPVAVNASLYRNAGYNPTTDLASVAMVATTPLVLVVPARLPAANVAELVSYLRARPGQVNFASGGAGTSLHLAALRFMEVADVSMQHVPYQGNALAIPDLINGLVSVLFSSTTTALPHIQSGALKALAVTTAGRSPALPNVPTVSEGGLPGYEFGAWYAILAPAGTPTAVRERLNGAVQAVLRLPAVREQFARFGAEPLAWSVQETEAFVKREYETWKATIQRANITID
jgi:tripartite-type tricarboxylate transporter receptor subunit TctC